ncbi:restriction endonuclease subunit S [Parasphingopyxis lamellibrachiae]|uniref:Type I restriction enzyme S subunit n=1 Tax=Parasphingopyxis lamellibrachiae TaxID=680125 RepID=A0A3D9FJF8_9SPHN|nr:restriction endonuclease subunit S [Parasphingopyxis lamellibrachiae]RED17717.1 type I restriction enzyme S subunit [Parasphingopyxis lamellibrachiae]
MSEWVEKPLGKLASFKKGKKVDTSKLPLDDYIPYLGASSLTGGSDGWAKPQGGIDCLSSDALLLWDGERSGLVGPGRGGVISSTVMRLRPESDMSGAYLVHLLRQNYEWIQARRTGTGVPHVPKDLGRILELRYPKNEIEQTTICDVLDCIDTQIEATEALIGKQERLRAGLMQDLFTRGVDENGELRPPREEAPHLYHETELGWLPKGWSAPEVRTLLASVPTPMRSGPFGSALLKHELVESGIPLLGIDNIHAEHFEARFSRFVTLRKFLELSRYRALPGDVVITIMGTIGRCCLVPEGHGDLLSSKHLWTMTFDPAKVIPELVCWQLNLAPWVLSWFRQQSQGGIMDAIQSSTLKRLRLPCATLPEQEQILQRYHASSGSLAALRGDLAKLLLQKTGLMQDLLTGTVSVEPLLEKDPA